MEHKELMNYLLDEAEEKMKFFLERQILDESILDGAVPEPDRLCPPFPRAFSSRLLEIIALWLNPASLYFANAEIPGRAARGLAFLRREQRPSGNIDLWDCNFDSAPDSGFLLWDLFPVYRFLENPGIALPSGTALPSEIAKYAPALMEEVKSIILTVLEGLRTGGFHTANHRWVMASSLAAGYRLTGNKAYLDRANEYLAEGIDCNEDGEYSERSAIYNAVNNQALIMLFEELGDKNFLFHVQRNLRMLSYYFEADESLFTGNSTRQDRGTKMFAGRYLYQYLYIAHYLGDREAAGMAEYIAAGFLKTKRKPGPDCLPFLMQHSELKFSGLEKSGFRPPDYNHYFKSSGIVRYKKNNFSYSLIHDNTAWLCFNSGTINGYCKISIGYFGYGHIKINNLETLENGYGFSTHALGWYFEPLEKPSGDLVNFRTEDHSIRKKQHPNNSDFRVTVRSCEKGIELDFNASGIDGVHYGFEFSLPSGIPVSSDSFVLQPKAGDYILLKNGGITLQDGRSSLSILGGFADTDLFISSRQAEPRNPDGFTVYMNGTVPFNKTVSLIS